MVVRTAGLSRWFLGGAEYSATTRVRERGLTKNPVRVMKNYKLIFTGPVGAGKTTAIRSVSNLIYKDGDVRVSDGIGMRKTTTTVAMDNGVLQIGEEERVHLYGTPGQERFRFMWDILANSIAKDCIGLAILIDNARNYPFRDLAYYLKEFRHLVATKKLVIAVTHTDIQLSPELDDYRAWLSRHSVSASVAQIDARKEQDVLLIIGMLLQGVSRFGEQHSASFANGSLKENDMEHSKKIPSSQLQDSGRDQEQGVPTVHDIVPQLTANVKNKDVAEGRGEAGEAVDGGVEERLTPASRQPGSIYNNLGKKVNYVEKVIMKESIVDEVMNIKGVKSAALVSSMGDITTSSIEDVEFNEFISFLSGIAKAFENTSNLGELKSVTLKSSVEDNLTIYLEDEQTLCVVSSGKVSVRMLNQQIDNVLQWGDK